jgi:hypothetical protein
MSKQFVDVDAAAAAQEADAFEEEGSYQDEDDLELDWTPEYHHGYNCPCGSMDCRNYMATTTGRKYKEYRHSEETG